MKATVYAVMEGTAYPEDGTRVVGVFADEGAAWRWIESIVTRFPLHEELREWNGHEGKAWEDRPLSGRECGIDVCDELRYYVCPLEVHHGSTPELPAEVGYLLDRLHHA